MKISKSLLLLVIIFSLSAKAQTGKIIKSFKTQGNYPTGLCFDGKNLWQADRETDKIYCINAEDGTLIKEIETPAYWATGLAWDGKFLWNVDFRGRTDKAEDRDGMIFKIDPTNGNILKTLRAPSRSPHCLATKHFP